MIIDSLNELCDAVSVAKTAGSTYLIGNQIDLGAAGVGFGKDAYLVITVDTAIITGGSAGTLSFALASDDSASISTSTSSIHWRSKEYVTDDAALNELDAGEVIVVPLPADTAEPYERYLGLLVTVTTTDTTAGKVNAFITFDKPLTKRNGYADASN